MITAALAIGAIAASAGTYAAMRSASLTGLVAAPRDDRWHRQPTPLLGGLGLLTGMLVAGVGVSLENGARLSVLCGLAAGVLIAFAVGLIDDVRPLDLTAKLAGQTAAAAAVVLGGVVIDSPAPLALDIVLTMLLVLACMNAVNLLDNMDGAAASVVASAALGLAAALVIAGAGAAVALLAGSLVVACLGFLVWNAPLPRARIFMGDCGSLPLGLALGCVVVLASNAIEGSLAHRLAPLLVLSVPALDTATVAITRQRQGRHFFNGGRDHLAHRLVYGGLSERAAVAVLLGGAVASSSLAGLALSVDAAPALRIEAAAVAAFVLTLTALVRATPPEHPAPVPQEHSAISPQEYATAATATETSAI